ASSGTPSPNASTVPIPTPTPVPSTPSATQPATHVTERTSLPTIAWGVPISDMARVKALGFQLVLKRYQPGVDPKPYLDAAGANGLKVLAWFPGTYALAGWSDPAALDPWVARVKSNPALYGYVSVIEPGASNLHIPITVIQTLYRHLKALDPTHPVIVSYGHLPVF